MGNIFRLFRNDAKRLFANVMSIIITVGLVVMPSIFAWYNIIACWNVFDNTGNLTVAVANTDEGYQSDLVPIKINVGEQVVSALRANDQIDWIFTDEEDAIDGAKSGRYYAAVVIPKDFSRDMLTFYSADVEHADIVYYANEKKSAIAPKITDKGADSVSYQVNSVFAETLSEVSLGLAEAFSTYAEDDNWDGRIAQLADHVRTVAKSVEDAAKVLGLYSNLAQACENLATDSGALAGNAMEAADATLDAAAEGAASVPSSISNMKSSTQGLSDALEKSQSGFDNAADKISTLFATASSDTAATVQDLRSQAKVVEAQTDRYRQLAQSLEALGDKLPSEVQPSVTAVVERLNSVATLSDSMAKNLRSAADKLEKGDTAIKADRDAALQRAKEAKAAIREIKSDFDTNVKPSLDKLVEQSNNLSEKIEGIQGTLKKVSSQLSSSADSAATALGGTAKKVKNAADKLQEVADNLKGMAADIDKALAAGDRNALKDVLSADVSVLSKALSAPVGLERIAVFPVENFGSAMAPLYTTLALFIGALLILVVMKPTVSSREIEEAGLVNVKPRQLFLGRFGAMALVSLAQTTLMGLGNLFFLQVQVAHPWLFMGVFWFAGLVFTFLIYALVFSFANLGKAIAVLLLIIQVTGCGGSFPLQLLPGFVQALSPWLPATHVVNAMRAAMMGTYGNDYWVQMGELALFLVPAALLGLVLRKPLAKFMNWYVEQVESSKLIG
ncbi:YhgE/Pip domain-containing protein [uncultured Adlercreutzia sp.]|uniref:YhgE/Pip domain-containing protein n=1 Tax=uncultured Adlercreutzia sp. TaxID=875803 RepID=UPI0025FAB10F|nr:YhgE/Pip domain-containing protein [uncultured Adlercreutzia sp.]MCI9262392.1 YhgE/Pip domain-containing protein [Eggerthellaceae bacterium]